jgi:tRNA-splicing endonuclease subunit Sen2
VLYKQGPPFYHASYIVLVEVIDNSTMMRIPGLQRNLSWTRLMGLNRVGETAGKVNRVTYISVYICMT